MPSNFTIDLASNAVVVHPNNAIGRPIGISHGSCKHDFTGELVLFGGHLLFLNELALPPLTDVFVSASMGVDTFAPSHRGRLRDFKDSLMTSRSAGRGLMYVRKLATLFRRHLLRPSVSRLSAQVAPRCLRIAVVRRHLQMRRVE